MSSRLGVRMLRFAEVYTGNATDAAQAAGYVGGRATLAQQGYRLMRDPRVRAIIEKRPPPSAQSDSRESQVYFIEMLGHGAIKIGSSRDVTGRLAQLRSASPFPLRLLGSTKGGRARELSEHRRWSRLRLNGEWFKATTALRDYSLSLGRRS